jgi:peptide subunit release factor 1 (eRF1)
MMRFFFTNSSPADIVASKKETEFRILKINVDKRIEDFWKELRQTNQNIKNIQDREIRGEVGKWILSKK